MTELPSGTVTFLFTDVEGSTQLLKQLRDRYGEVLSDHRRILRAAFAEHGGREIDTQGDAFFVAFQRAHDAALAAVAAQRGLAAHEWPEGAACRVRMGLHTGEPNVGDEGYHGLGVHRAARIMAAGHGGQILLSQATCSVLEDDGLPGVEIRDVGLHQLKDLDRPEHIFQLAAEGLPAEFPPLRTAAAETAYTGLEDELEAAAQAAVQPRRLFGLRRPAVLITVGLVAFGVTAFLVAVLSGSHNAKALDQVDVNAVGLVNPQSDSITAEVPVGATPSHIAVGANSAWVTNADDDTVSRIDLAKKSQVETIGVGHAPSGVAFGNGAVWVANSLEGTVSRIDPGTNKNVQTIDVGNGPGGIAYGDRSVWVANSGDGTVTRIDAVTGVPSKPLQIAATELAYGGGSLWASDRSGNRVLRIDPRSGNPIPIPVGSGPTGLAFGRGSLWVANSLDGTISRIDPSANRVTNVIPVGNGVTSVAVGNDRVWVSEQYDGALAAIDPRTNQRVRRIVVGNRPSGVAAAAGAILVSVRQSGAGHRGGTLTVRMNRPPDSIDPTIAYDSTSWPILRMTNDGLVTFNEVSGFAGTQLVPDLAISLPSPTDGGRTYTFKLRDGIRYSTGARVKASDFRFALERLVRIGKWSVPAYYEGIVGFKRCERRPASCDLSRGVVADDKARTVTFHLVAPDGEFLYKLALHAADPVPPGTPVRAAGTHPVAATGPYEIENYVPGHRLTLVRNPRFHEWLQAAQPDGYPDTIVFTIGGTPDSSVQDVISGRADAFSTAQSENPPSQKMLGILTTRYAGQVHSNPQPTTVGLFLNTRLPPFDRLGVRRALNYAADRKAVVEVTGGPEVAQATCQILPPHFPGYSPYCPWPAPDLARARALVTASGTRGMKVTFWSWSALPGIGRYAVRLLRSLGYRVTVKQLGDSYFAAVGDSRSRAQIGTAEWIADYPAASGFFNAIFSCGSFIPNSQLNLNEAEFCNPQLDGKINRALTAQATNPDAARGLWESVDRETVDEAPWVPLVNPNTVDVVSKRVGNYQYSPNGLGVPFDQLWVR